MISRNHNGIFILQIFKHVEMKKIMGATNYEVLSTVGRQIKFFISNRLKRLEKLNICRSQVMFMVM